MHSHPRLFLLFVQATIVVLCASMLFSIAPMSASAVTTTTVTKNATTSKVPTVKTIKKKAKVAKATSVKAAAQPFEITGWIPYWRTATGTMDVLPHLAQLKRVNPFGYTVKLDGSLYDASKLEQPGVWDEFIARAHATKTQIVPSVMWSDTASIANILGDPIARAKHEDAIVAMLTRNNFDGVDIDYEGKLASSRDDYSAFLKELAVKLTPTNKLLTCTIESRTPPESLYKVIPADLEYANDYKEINKYCDRVVLMTYDQQSADIKLNKASDGLYSPVSDPLWVAKVVNFAAKDISKSKIIVGIPTYGYIYQVTPWDDGTGYHYDLTEAFNPRYATELATTLNITPVRNRAGELSFTYIEQATSTSSSTPSVTSYAPSGTDTGLLAALGATQLAKTNGVQTPFTMLWWSDAKAVSDKVKLAKSLGVRGVAVFKFDSGEDQGIWNVLK